MEQVYTFDLHTHLLEKETELAQYEMSGEIGGFSIPTKETFINLVKFMEQFGPLEAEHYDRLRTKTLEKLEKLDSRKTAATQNIIKWLDQRIETGEMTKAEAAVHLFMIILMGHEIGHHKIRRTPKISGAHQRTPASAAVRIYAYVLVVTG